MAPGGRNAGAARAAAKGSEEGVKARFRQAESEAIAATGSDVRLLAAGQKPDSAGVTKVSSKVALIRPEPNSTLPDAGFRTRLLGLNNGGASAKAATQRVISTGASGAQRTADDHRHAKDPASGASGFRVVADLQDAVAGGDAGQRDEVTAPLHRQRLPRTARQAEHAANQLPADVGHDQTASTAER